MFDWRSVQYMINILLMISFIIQNIIYTRELLISRVNLKKIEKKYCGNDLMPGELRFMAVYEKYMHLRREDVEFNEKLGNNKNFFDLLIEYQRIENIFINNLEKKYIQIFKFMSYYQSFTILINSIGLLIIIFQYIF